MSEKKITARQVSILEEHDFHVLGWAARDGLHINQREVTEIAMKVLQLLYKARRRPNA